MKKTSIALAIAILVSTFNPAFAETGSKNIEGFDFNYTTETHNGFNLLQVFDDGDMTYFQFAEQASFPTVEIVSDDGKRVTVNLESKTPYLIVRAVANKFILHRDGKSIVVHYNGKRELSSQYKKYSEIDSTNSLNQLNDDAFEQPLTASSKNIKNKRVRGAVSDDRRYITNITKHNGVVVERTITDLEQDHAASADSPKENPQNHVSVQAALHDDATQTKSKTEIVEGIKLTVPFLEDSLTVSKSSKESIQDKASQLRFTHRAIVHGRPSAEDNQAVANARAYAMKAILLDAGMREDNIEVSAEHRAIKGKKPGFYLSEIVLVPSKNVTSHKAGEVVAMAQKTPEKPKLEIKVGDSLSQKITEWAKKYDYTVVWEASDFRSGADILISKDFDATLKDVIGAMNMNGVKLDATVYSNKIVRVVEFK